MYYVYILENQNDKSWYIGYSANLRKRIKDHLSGNGCRTTSLKSGWVLIYYESYVNKYDAIGKEIIVLEQVDKNNKFMVLFFY